MRIAYDHESRGLMIRFRDGRYAESEEVVPGVVVDFDAEGRAIGIELEDVNGLVDEVALERIVQPHVKDGADLRSFRDAWGMTQQQLAHELNIPSNTVARWERDELRIEKPRLLELALRGLFTFSASTGTASRAAKQDEIARRPMKQSVARRPPTKAASHGGQAAVRPRVKDDKPEAPKVRATRNARVGRRAKKN